jgi:hypothetical protein
MNGNTVKKNRKFSCRYKELQKRSGAKLYMRKGFLIFEEMRKYLKVWWQDATLFVYFSYFNIFYSIHTFIHSITFIQYMYPSPFAGASHLSPLANI